MKSITFPEVTHKIAERQEEFNTVHAQFQEGDNSVNMCFELDSDEIEEIKRTGKIWYKQVVSNGQMHPMRLSPFKSQIIE